MFLDGLALTSESVPVASIHVLLDCVKAETRRRGVTSDEVLGYLRDKVREMALAHD